MSDTVADVLLARLREWDVGQVFGYPGDGINGLLAAWGRAGDEPQFVQARHEEMAAFEAVGFAKFSGQVGVCVATSGPGADPPAQRPVRRQARPRAGGRHRRADRALGDGRLLPAGGRSAQPVQGRLQRLRADVHGAAAVAQPDRPGHPDRGQRESAPTCIIFPSDVFELAVRGAGTRVQAGALQPRASAGPRSRRTTTRSARPPTCSTPGEGGDAGRPGRSRLRGRS